MSFERSPVVFQTGSPTLGVPLFSRSPDAPAPAAPTPAVKLDVLLRLQVDLAALAQQLLLLEARVSDLETPWYRRLWAWLQERLHG